MTNIEQMMHAQRMYQQTLCRMTDDLRWLLSHAPGSVEWMLPKCYLVELVHLVAQQRTIIGEDGAPLMQCELLRRAFAVVGQPVPRHYKKDISRLPRRVHIDRSMPKRYEHLADEENIIQHFIKIH